MPSRASQKPLAAGAAPVDGGKVAKAMAPATQGMTSSHVARALSVGFSARQAANANSAHASGAARPSRQPSAPAPSAGAASG